MSGPLDSGASGPRTPSVAPRAAGLPLSARSAWERARRLTSLNQLPSPFGAGALFGEAAFKGLGHAGFVRLGLDAYQGGR